MKSLTLVFVLLMCIPAVVQGQMHPSSRVGLFQSTPQRQHTISLQFDKDISTEKKNVGLAVFYSLLLPGMGELYVGEYAVGKYFTIAEGMLWLTYASFETYGTWLRDDARDFARTHAAIQTEGKDQQFFVDIGNFLTVRDYNERKLRDREPEKLYDVNTHYWEWASDADRASYRRQRIAHDRMFNNNKFVVAAVIVNHIVSAVNAGRLAIGHNRRLAQTSFIDIHASVLGTVDSPHGIQISFSKSF